MIRQQFDLINGIFEGNEAKEVLLYLIDGKIQFHNRRIFSDKVRLGTINEASVKRINELEGIRSKILKIADNETELSIKSSILIESLEKTNAA